MQIKQFITITIYFIDIKVGWSGSTKILLGGVAI